MLIDAEKIKNYLNQRNGKKEKTMAIDPAIMAINQSIIDSIPVLSLIYAGLNTVQVLAGGIFGLALIGLIINILFRQKEVKLLNQIQEQLNQMSKRISNLEKKKR